MAVAQRLATERRGRLGGATGCAGFQALLNNQRKDNVCI